MLNYHFFLCVRVFLIVCGEDEGMEVAQGTQGEHVERRKRVELELVEVNIATAAAAALASAATKAKVRNNHFISNTPHIRARCRVDKKSLTFSVFIIL